MSRVVQPGWRTAAVGVLVTIAGLAVPLAVLATWTASWLNSPDRFAIAMAGLRSEPEVQAVVSEATAAAVMAGLDVESLTSQWLEQLAGAPLIPPRTSQFLPSLSGPITSMVGDFVREQVATALASDGFARVWDAATAEIHAQVTALLTSDEAPHLLLENGHLHLRIGPFVAAARELLVERGFRIARAIPDTDAAVALAPVDPGAVAAARAVHRILGLLVVLLPAVGVVALAGALLLERDRRRLPVAFGFSLAGAGLLVLAALEFGGRWGATALAAGGFSDAGGQAVLELLFGELRWWLWGCVAVGVVMAVVGLGLGLSAGGPAARPVPVASG